VPLTEHQLAAEHARAMRIVQAVLAVCDARAATARAARDNNLKPGDAPWVLAVGKAAIGMAEGVKDACGRPHRHLIVTVDGPPALSLPNVLRSDHPLPTQRSLAAGNAVRRFIEEAKAAHAPSLTVLISGGASSLICEPIPGVDLDDCRAAVQAMLTAGWDIQRMNTVRRAIDELKGGGLAALAAPLPVDLLVISDVIGNTLCDIGSGPFVQSPTSPEDARSLLAGDDVRCQATNPLLEALACRPRGDAPPPPRRAIVAMDNSAAVAAAVGLLHSEGFTTISVRPELSIPADAVVWSAGELVRLLAPDQAFVWGGEWPINRAIPGVGGRCQYVASRLKGFLCSPTTSTQLLAFATDGADGAAPEGRAVPAGAFVSAAMTSTTVNGAVEIENAGPSYRAALAKLAADPSDDLDLIRWAEDNSYHVLAHGDKHRRPGEPPAHIFTGPTGTNVNDLLIAWRV